MFQISLVLIVFILIIITLIIYNRKREPVKKNYVERSSSFTINGPQFYFPGKGNIYS